MSSAVRAAPVPSVALAPERAARSAVDSWGRALVLVVVLLWAVGLAAGLTGPLIAFGIVGLGAAIAGLLWPPVGLLGVVLLCTLDPIMRALLAESGIWRWNTFNYWLLVAAALYYRVVLLRIPPIMLLRWLVLLMALELLISPDPSRGVQAVLRVAAGFGLLVYTLRAASSPEVWSWAALISSLTGAIGGAVLLVRQPQLAYINPNAWAYLPLTSLVVTCFGMAFVVRRRTQVVLAFLSTINLGWVFLSGSRGAMLSGICCAIMLLLSFKGKTPRLAFLLSAMGMVLAVSMLFGNLQAYAMHRIGMLLSEKHSLSARTSRRSELAKAGWQVFLQHPLGLGTGGFAVTYSSLDLDEGRALARERKGKDAHSAWIKVLAENGVPGLLLLSGFTLSFAWIGLQCRDRRRRLLGAFASIMMAAAFMSTEFQAKAPWLTAAAALALLLPRELLEHWTNPARSTSSARSAGR